MKSLVLSLMILLPILGFSQIGIGTTTPTATLDVNGDFRIRTTTSNTRETAAKDSIMCNEFLLRKSSKAILRLLSKEDLFLEVRPQLA